LGDDLSVRPPARRLPRAGGSRGGIRRVLVAGCALPVWTAVVWAQPATSQEPLAPPGQQSPAPQPQLRLRVGVVHAPTPNGDSQFKLIQATAPGVASDLAMTFESIPIDESIDPTEKEKSFGSTAYDLILQLIRPIPLPTGNIPVILPQASADSLDYLSLPNSRFGVNVAPRARTTQLADYLRERLVGRIAVLYEDSEFGRDAERSFRSWKGADPYMAIAVPVPTRTVAGSASRARTSLAVSVSDSGSRLRNWQSELQAFRPEALGIFAPPAATQQIRDEIAPGMTLPPVVFFATDPRDAAGPIENAAFVSAVQPDSAPGCPVGVRDAGDLVALSYDILNLVTTVMSGAAQPSRPLTDEQILRERLSALFNESGKARGPCTDMQFRAGQNVAQPIVYESISGKISPAPNLSAFGAVKFRIAVLVQVYGSIPFLILIFFAFWSVVWASREALGHWGLSRSGLAALFTALRLAILICAYAWLAQRGMILWDSLFSAVALAGISELAFSTPLLNMLHQAASRKLARRRTNRRYKHFQAALNVIAFSNTFEALQQSAFKASAELHAPEGRKAPLNEIDLSFPHQASPDVQRMALALTLLENLSWGELKDRGLVPQWALDRNSIVDPEKPVEALVNFCEQRALTADDLDRYIRRRIELPVSLAAYESTLAENQNETSERRRLVVRSRFLVRMLGPQAGADREKMAATITAIKAAAMAPVPAATSTGTALNTLKLLSVELMNIRCFRSLILDFSEEGKPRPWTMLLGDNGLGKSTILRSIVMALCDQTSATALMGRLLPGELLRQQTNEGRIRVRLTLPDAPGQEIWTETTLVRNQNGTIELRQSTSTWFPRELLFVCGYGALRSGFGTESYSGYAIADAVATLFDPKASLQNPELALRRMMSAATNMDRVCRQIESVLLLPENSTEFGSSGLSIKGDWGEFVPIGAIGDGYLATLAWLSDLLGWTFLYRPDFIAGNVFAIVVLDEIEKHLHPRWQREIVLELSRQFPQVQFIASTHSPLCAGGLADLKEEEAAMYRLQMTGSGAVSGEKLDPYRGWTYDQIMTSSAFGLKSVRDVTTQEIVDELRVAHEGSDKKRIQEIEDKLESRSVIAADDERERQMKTKLIRDIEELQQRVELQTRPGNGEP
jgi:hypothetical protein